MSSIDNRIVQMNFNNREFENGVATTKQSIEELDASLNKLGKGADSQSLSMALNGVGSSVDEVTGKFNAFETIVTGIFLRLGAQIEEFAATTIKSLTLDNLTDGYQKYESIVSATAGLYNVGAYQGKTEEEIDKYIEELTWYADATSFSLDSMISALLSMGNAGVDLGNATAQIEGMGNAFMYAGVSATACDGAFYMLTKSMGDAAQMTGGVYNSLSNTYHVLSPELIQRIIDTAVAMGKFEEGLITLDNFKSEGLKKGYITGDVLQSVFGEYGAYSNELYNFINDLEATTGEVYDTITSMELFDEATKNAGEEVNEWAKAKFIAAQEAKLFTEVLDALKDAASSQWAGIATSIIGDYKQAKELFGELYEYLDGIFVQPVRVLAKTISEMTTSEMANGLTGREGIIQAFRNLGEAARMITTPIKEAWQAVFGVVTSGDLLKLVEGFQNFTEKLILSEKYSNYLKDIFKGIFTLFGGVLKVLQGVFKIVKDLMTPVKSIISMLVSAFAWINKGIDYIINLVSGLDLLNEAIVFVTAKFTNFKTRVGEFFASFENGVTILETIRDAFSDVKIDFGGDVIDVNSIIKNVEEAFTKLKENIKLNISDLNGNISFQTITDSIIEAYDKAIQYLTEHFSGLFETLKKVKEEVFYFIDNIAKKLAEFTKNLFSSTAQVAEEELSLLDQYRSAIRGDKSPFDKFLEIIRKILETLEPLLKLDILRNVSKLIKSWKSVPNMINNLSDNFNQLSKVLKDFQKNVKAGSLKKIALAFVALAAGMLIMSTIDQEKYFGVLAGTISILSLMIVMLKTIGKINATQNKLAEGLQTVKIGAFLLELGLSLVLMAVALKTLSTIDENAMTTAIRGFTVIMAELLILIYVIGKLQDQKYVLDGSKDMGVMFLKLASGMLIMAKAISAMAEIPSEDLWRGVAAIGVLMLELVAFLGILAGIQKLSKSKLETAGLAALFLSLAVSILLIAGALSLMVKACDGNAETLFTAALSIGIIIAAIALLVAATQSADVKTILALGVSLALISVGILAIAAAAALIGKLDPSTLASGFAYIVGIVAGLIAAGVILSQFGGAKELLLFAAGMVAFAIAIAAFAAVVCSLGNIGWPELMDNLGKLIVILVPVLGILALIHAMKLDVAMAIFAASMWLMAKAIAGLIAAIMLFTMIDWTGLGQSLLEGILTICAVIVEAKDPIIEALVSLGEIIIAALAQIFFMLISRIAVFISALFSETGATLEYGGVQVQVSIKSIFQKIFAWLKENWPAMKEKLITGIKNLITKLGEALGKLKDKFKEVGKKAIDGLVSGFKEKVESAVSSVKNIGTRIINGLKDKLGIKSPSKEFAKLGAFCVDGLAKGIEATSSEAETASENLGKDTLSAFASIMDTASDSISDLNDEITITPVLDLSEIQNGKSLLSSMFSNSNYQIGSLTTSTDLNLSLIDKIDSLRTDLANSISQNSNESLTEALKNALSGVGVYMDRTKVGDLVTKYQLNAKRASGV